MRIRCTWFACFAFDGRCVRNDHCSMVLYQWLTVNTVPELMRFCFQQLFRMLYYCQQIEEEKESDATLITITHNHAILCTSEAVHGNKMILRSYCSLGTLHRGRARKSLRAAWEPNTTTVSTHIRIIYAHTAQARHGGEWIRSEGQTPSHHGDNIPASAVGLTSTSRAPASPKPGRPSLATLSASHPCDAHIHTPKGREEKSRKRSTARCN